MTNKTIRFQLLKNFGDTQNSKASRQNFPSQKKTHSANNACLTKQSNSYLTRTFGAAQNSKCLEQEISNFKENRQSKPCMPNKTIQFQLIKNCVDSQNSKASRQNFPSQKKTHSANHACLTKKSDSYESRTFGEAQNSICLEQEISIFF